MAIHCCIWFEQKCQLSGTFRGGVKYFEILYLNDYAEFDSKISYNVLHGYPVKYIREGTSLKKTLYLRDNSNLVMRTKLVRAELDRFANSHSYSKQRSGTCPRLMEVNLLTAKPLALFKLRDQVHTPIALADLSVLVNRQSVIS